MSVDVAAFVLALANIVGFLVSACGAALVVWGAVKAARRAFWTEAEPWRGSQVPKLEEIRTTFGHRILLGLEFFLAGDLIRLLVDPSIHDLIRIGTIVFIRVILSLVVTREIRLPVLDLRTARSNGRVRA